MKIEIRDRKKRELKKLLKSMNIPDDRNRLNENNLRWLFRNIMPYNMNHPELYKCLGLIKEII